MDPRSLAVLALLVMATGAHAQVYRWVDTEGNTHYGDRPPGTAKDVRTVTVPSPTPAAPPAAPAPAVETGEDRREAPEAPRETSVATGEMARRAEERRQLGCDRARERLAEVESARYVYRKDGRGNRIVLTDEERDRAVSEAHASVRRLCR